MLRLQLDEEKASKRAREYSETHEGPAHTLNQCAAHTLTFGFWLVRAVPSGSNHSESPEHGTALRGHASCDGAHAPTSKTYQ